jgi:hypothetical protein
MFAIHEGLSKIIGFSELLTHMKYKEQKEKQACT